MNAAIEQPQGEIGGGFDAQERRPQPDAGVAATFDTSGAVTYFNRASHHTDSVQWSDLSPFVQGYVASMLAELDAWIDKYGDPILGPDQNPPRFSDLAPETLARIMEDCERSINNWPHSVVAMTPGQQRAQGLVFWDSRQDGMDGFPRLTVTLGDDGKVRFQ